METTAAAQNAGGISNSMHGIYFPLYGGAKIMLYGSLVSLQPCQNISNAQQQLQDEQTDADITACLILAPVKDAGSVKGNHRDKPCAENERRRHSSLLGIFVTQTS